jgi:5-methyltetrahydropteroyltriglutamate--homocysteine methyltransferase
VDYEGLLPELFQLKAGRFYLQMTSEPNRKEIFQQIRQCMGKDHLVLIGVTSPICSRIETPEEVCASLLEAASWIPADQLGSTDDCGFSPFADDTSTARDIAFAKVRSRVEGTAMAAQRLGLR